MMVKQLVKSAIKRMLEAGEFDKIRNMYFSEGNIDAATEVDILKRNLEDAERTLGGIENIPIIPLVYEIKDAEVWKDIVVFMISEEARENNTDDSGN